MTTQYGYGSDGDQTSVTSPNGNTPYIGYDQLGRQSYTTDAPIAIHSYNATPHTTTAYDGDGDVAEVKNGNEDVTDASYDPQGRLVSYTNAISGTTLLTYNANELTAMQDPQGNVTTYAYDAAGRLTQQADAAGEVIGYGYDTANNVTTITYGDGTTALRTETRTYDALDLVSTDSISGENLSGSLTTTYNRDLRGNLVREQHPNNDVTFTSYDLVDQVIAREIDRGNPNSPSGTRQETFGFDLAGNPISQTDMRGAVSTLTRDGDDRVTRQVDQYTGSPTITTSISYDPDGNVPSQTQTINGQSVQASTGYNAMDWPTSTTDNGLTTSYVGDGQGRTQQQTIQNGAASSPINLDNLGRANSIGDGTDSAAFTYDGNNLLTTVTLPGNAREAMRYDGASRLLETTAFASSLSDSFSYGYDHVGWTTSVNSTVTGVGSSNQTLTHDGQGRLLATSGAPVTGAWAYDGQDNISTATHNSVTSTYSYDPFAANELSSVATPGQATVNYSYDANGDTTSISNGGSVNEHLSYDAQGRLAQVTLGSPVTQTIAMTYNAQGKRASYTVTPAGAGQPSLAEQFAYRDDGELAQVATSGTRVPTAYTDTYLYRQDGSPLELIRVAGGTTSRYWYVLDGRDNVVALTDVHGNVVDSYQYDLWGKPTSSSESVPPALPPDPSELEGMESYVYAQDNPIDNADPSGLETCMYNATSTSFICDKSGFCADIETILHDPNIVDKLMALGDLALWVPGLDEAKAVELLGKFGIDAERATELVREGEAVGCALCFPAGTLVATPHGQQAIQTLKAGDQVLAEDPSTGKVQAESVQPVIHDPASALISVDLSDGSSIAVTADHPFWVDRGILLAKPGWIPAGELRFGDELRTARGGVASVVGIRRSAGVADVYYLWC